MKTIVHLSTGFRVPEHGGWSITGALMGEDKLFYRGQGRFAFKTKGKPDKVWERQEIPAPPKEPSNRFTPDDVDFTAAYQTWLAEWKAYAEKWGPACAAEGLYTCDMMKEHATIALLSASIDLPAELSRRFQKHFNVTPHAFSDARVYCMTGMWSFDLFKFLRRVMSLKGDSFEAFEQRHGSAKNWLRVNYSRAASRVVADILAWRPTDEEMNTRNAFVNEYCRQRNAAMNTTRKVK